jgi:hypothetical protein
MIWFSDLVESAENFEAFFAKADNKILNTRNVWLVNYRNFGDSDHHESFDMNVSVLLSLITFNINRIFQTTLSDLWMSKN